MAERMKDGKMKMASVSVIRTSGSAAEKRIRKTSAFFRKLSLNALKNWHQNRGAKRRLSNRLEDIQRFRVIVPGPSRSCRRLVVCPEPGSRRPETARQAVEARRAH